MEKLANILYTQPKHYVYLSIFRVYICFHLLKKFIFLWPSLDTIYGANSFASPYNDLLASFVSLDFLHANYKVLLFVYLTLVLLYLFGIGKHFTALGVYFCLELFQRLNFYILNGGDNLLKFFLLYMVFCDSYQYLSLKKTSYKKELLEKISYLLTNLGRFSICLHLCMVYLITAMHKMHSKVWFNGVAIYYTLSLERFAGSRLNPIIAENGFIVTMASYGTLFWEMYFPVLVWFKKLRIYLMLCGVGLHLGIYWFMMIHDFQILFLMSYGFFFTDEEWKAGLHRLSRLPGLAFLEKAFHLETDFKENKQS